MWRVGSSPLSPILHRPAALRRRKQLLSTTQPSTYTKVPKGLLSLIQSTCCQFELSPIIFQTGIWPVDSHQVNKQGTFTYPAFLKKLARNSWEWLGKRSEQTLLGNCCSLIPTTSWTESPSQSCHQFRHLDNCSHSPRMASQEGSGSCVK